jgi:hypothetical protein
MAIQFEIHPSVGIARLGTSDESFLGPGPGVPAPALHRDAAHKLKKQAARFQVFQCDRDGNGQLLSPPVPVSANVRWTVEVANRKATALKLDQVAGGTARRNGATGNDATDRELIIAPAARGVDVTNPSSEFDDGMFRGLQVKLGKAQMQADGSLVFTGGSGLSGSRTASGGTRGLQHFADNDDWWDDTCEGRVQAEVKLGDGSLKEAAAARVIVAPPDFAPEIEAFVTLYDIAYQAAVDQGFLQPAAVPSFSRHIAPFLRRAVGYGWVNQRAGAGHMGMAGGNFEARLAQLGNPALPKAIRMKVFNRLRKPDDATASGSSKMPRLFSEQGYREGQKRVLALPPVFYHYLEQWANGNFTGDAGVDPFAGEEAVDAMDRMSLQACAGGGFFPGIEAPRFVREKEHWVAAFRLDGSLPAGRVTEGLATPWQADFMACQWEGGDDDDPDGFAWWPSQRPDRVFRAASDIATNARVRWDRGLSGAEDMIRLYSELGYVVRQTSPSGDVFLEAERVLP